jgi:hypothetical protein
LRGRGFKIDVGQHNQKKKPTYQNCAMQKRPKKKDKKNHMQSLLGVFCVSHMPNLSVVNIKK